MSQSVKQVKDEITQYLGTVPEWTSRLPEQALGGFWTLMRDFELAETTIPNKYKELIGIAVAGATRCRYCTLFHTEAARLNGANDKEIAEAAFMGSLTMAASTFVNAEQVDYDQFAKETRQIVQYVRKNMQQGKKPEGPRAQA
jgi:AhpD family alkylhydroperoxidase